MDNNILQDKKVKQGVVAVLSILAIFLFVQVIAGFQAIGGYVSPNYNAITVNGVGEVSAIADIGAFTYTIEEEGGTVAQAQEKASAKSNKALEFLKEAGVEEKDIKTQNYSTNPKYQYSQVPCTPYSCPPSNPKIIGYTVNQSFEVKVRDVAKAGDLLTKIGSVGVQYISGLSFTIDDEEILKSKAREMAIKDAREKAKKLAKDLGVDLDDVMGFYENNGEMPYGRDFGGAGGAMEAKVMTAVAPKVPTGENKITITVSVTYRIK